MTLDFFANGLTFTNNLSGHRPRRNAALFLCAALLWCTGSVHAAEATATTQTTSSVAQAREVRAAVAANFTAAMNEISRDFTAATGQRVVASFGASGQLSAQIANGAPFDVLLAADNQYSAALIEKDLAVADSKFVYAQGKLALWSSVTGYVDDKGQVLKDAKFEKIAIANPKLAPYGRAAEQTLQALGLFDAVKARFITGENIAQTQQFIASGNVPLGFVALAQVYALPETQRGSYWIVPAELYQPLEQEAILLKTAEHNEAARAFLAYLKTPAAQAVIRRLGYDLPR